MPIRCRRDAWHASKAVRADRKRCVARIAGRVHAARAATAQSSDTVWCQAGISAWRPSASTFGSSACLGRRVAVDEVHVARHARVAGAPPADEAAEPREQLGLVGVRGEAVERPDRRLDLHLVAGDPRRRGAADEVAAERALALVADEQHGRRRVVEQPLRVAHGPSARQHPVRGDDDQRRRGLGDPLRLLDVLDDVLAREVERRLVRLQQRIRLLVVRLGVVAVDLRRRLRHRRIQVDRQVRDAARVQQPAQLPHDLLGPPDRERGDEQDALPPHRVVHDVGERVDRLARRLVLAAAVGGLAQDEVALGDGRRVADDRRAGPAEVAREHDDRVAPAARAREPHAHDG